eukprot:CAMPEP_0185575270 /NCGR_PEP_ID=MMETSP0434-20130131/6513_1 /TAXON_ID=626734 ORGANISM="Favella taraikaensis, Strain Fe Narragansett Bay" /NCGR_SAMPLE_ID=MMETSP0434 /ASSEMBLY_ACC=CAM_ASM_000379 /LENGTH=67 /DNA_ID=CAMNT_0028192105 /DNA_START=1297 /DNA_END=1500 /DNA_ORIENTATION=+
MAPLDTGVNRKKNMKEATAAERELSEQLPKGYAYDPIAHFNGPKKLCHATLGELLKEEEEKLKKRQL